jgi:hypothetical protein
MAKSITAQIENRTDTSTNWTNNNPMLGLGEIGIESDTTKMKIGDGVTSWNNLAYHSSIAEDVTNSKTYKYYLQIVDGVTQFVYEEVV